jgi:hypothetical protein
VSHTTTEKLFDGRWRLRTTDDAVPERFVSTVQLNRGDLLFEAVDRLADMALRQGGRPGIEASDYETILHDETGWVLQPDGRNAIPAATKEEARANHDRAVLMFFGRDA